MASDLHARGSLYAALHDAVAEHRPDALILLGDFMHALEPERGMLSIADCARAVSALDVPQVVLVRGNHEGMPFLDFSAHLSSSKCSPTTLHGEAARIGQLVVVGFPCLLGDETAFTLTKPPLPSTPGAWLPPLLRRIGPAGRAIWLMHEPPAGTKLSERSGPLAGNAEWTELIERFAPRLVVCGHDHQTPMRAGAWQDRIGDTLVINVGQSDGERLHYSVIEATLGDGEGALPNSITVRAYPWLAELVNAPGAPGLRSPVPLGADRASGDRVAGSG